MAFFENLIYGMPSPRTPSPTRAGEGTSSFYGLRMNGRLAYSKIFSVVRNEMDEILQHRYPSFQATALG